MDQDQPKTAKISKAEDTRKPLVSAATRVFDNQVKFDSDLFKLKLSKMKKNITPNKDDDAWLDVEHSHFFHTVDSSGKIMSQSAAVGGHFHMMDIVRNKQGEIVEIKCSGPKEFKHDKRTGRKMIVDANPGKGKAGFYDARGNEQPHPATDNHTHEVEYIRSSKLMLKNANTEAVKFLAQESAKLTPPPEIAPATGPRPNEVK